MRGEQRGIEKGKRKKERDVKRGRMGEREIGREKGEEKEGETVKSGRKRNRDRERERDTGKYIEKVKMVKKDRGGKTGGDRGKGEKSERGVRER